MLTSTTSSLWQQLKASLQAPSAQPPVSLLCTHRADAGLAVHLPCPQLQHTAAALLRRHACQLHSAARPCCCGVGFYGLSLIFTMALLTWIPPSLSHLSR